MSDLVEQARTARTHLAQALSLLQSPEAGNLIDTVAEPVARAMGALHQLETSGGVGVSEKASSARDAVRSALAVLQAAPASAAGDRATEIIADSLGLLHGLVQRSERPPAPAEVASTAVVTAPMATPSFDRTQLSSEPHIPLEPAPARAAPGGVLDATLPTPQRAPNFAAASASDDFTSTRRSVSPSADDEPVAQGVEERPSQSPPRRNSKHAPMPDGADANNAQFAEANLGAHSPTNFYKGLSGNDVVDDGGLFVSTYDVPAIGTKLQLSVNMPGGYVFEALAVVRWTRESGVGDAPPGFGCAFTSITQEARQLIYRYVRNREPLFHDDL